MLRRWRDLLASLGSSLFEVAEAELTALKTDLRVSGRQLGSAVLLAAVAGLVVFWAMGAAGFALYQLILLWLPGWASALIVLGFFAAVALVLGLVARARFRSLEAPVETVRRRVDDHLNWWHENLLQEEKKDEREQIEE